MNSFTAAALACRILALYVVIGLLANISWLPLAIMSARQVDSDQLRLMGSIFNQQQFRLSTLLSFLIPELLQIAFAAFLWIKAGWLARLMTATLPDEEAGPITGSSLQRIMLTLIGIFIVAATIPETGRAIVVAMLSTHDPIANPENVLKAVPENWSLLLRFGTGLGLIFGASALSRRLDNYRSL